MTWTMTDYEPQAEPSSTSSSSSDSEFEDDEYVHLSDSELLRMWNVTEVFRKLNTKDKCIAFSEEQGLLPKERRCPTHKTTMKISYLFSESLGTFVCPKGSCNTKIPRRNGTLFENIHIELVHLYYLMYAYAQNWSVKNTIREDPHIQNRQRLSTAMIMIDDWFNYCREAVVIYQLENQTQFLSKIGGPGKVVQIDESKFGKRKFNRGSHIEGYWLLGIIEDGSKDLRLEVCPDNIRSAEVLVPLIQKHVEVGTTIHTDHWQAYECLNQHGYIHKKVNHSKPAVDGTHSQMKGSQWRVVKRYYRKEEYNNAENFTDMIARFENFTDMIVEFLWRRNNYIYKKDPFMDLLKAVQHVYKL